MCYLVLESVELPRNINYNLMKPIELTATLIKRKEWMIDMRNMWQRIVYREKFDETQDQFMRRHLIRDIERYKDKPGEMKAIRHIIVYHLPTLMACELIEEYNL